VTRAVNLLQAWWPRRVSSRIVALFLGLLLLVQLAGFAVVRVSINQNARSLLSQDLELGERVWARLLAQRAQKLLLGASVLAADYGFRAAAASGDNDTLRSALDNHGARIGATLTAMLAPDLSTRALGEGTSGEALAALRPVAARLAEQGSALMLVAGQPYQVVMVPMKAPLLVGYVVIGFALDQALIDDMHAVSGLHAAILVRTALGPERVVLSTLHEDAAAQLLGATMHGELVTVDNNPHVFRSITQAAATSPHSPSLRTLLLRSVDDAVAPYRPLQATLAFITLTGLLMAGAAGVFTARRVTTPLRSLVQASENLGRGDYSQAMQHTERKDEIGELARSFDHMRSNIAAQEAQVRQLAYWDHLTGLPNRAQFRDAVRAAIVTASSTQQPLAVLMLDLDRFKHVNDVLGYAFGDRLLKGVADRLSGQGVRDGDLWARISGDEFALLLLGSDANAALAVAERVADSFQAPMTLDDHTVDLAAGFGVACWPAHAADADTLISRAEVAMYTAKRKTCTAMVYDPAIDAGSARSLSLLSELRRALDKGELRLYLQPKIALSGAHAGRLVGAEALVRWQHPTRGQVPPMDFIPFAEQTGFVRQLTLWMLEATAKQWSALSALGLQRVAVNLSTRDLLDQELPQKIEQLTRRHGMPAQALCLEITESAIMDEPQRALATLNALSAAGFKLSIDDFGTGYSSLAYLKRLPVDELKIDRSFVMAMETDEDDATIVRSTIDLAHNMGLTVVAEGVENEAVLRRLTLLACDEAQGFHMSRPLPVAEMAAFATRWAAKAEAGGEASKVVLRLHGEHVAALGIDLAHQPRRLQLDELTVT
jgi:diguanylate cyclase (GGDEF)-like protein